MAEEEWERAKHFWMPKYYYWGKSPPRPKAAQTMPTKFANAAQRRFYFTMVAFKVAKVVALATVVVLVLQNLQ